MPHPAPTPAVMIRRLTASWTTRVTIMTLAGCVLVLVAVFLAHRHTQARARERAREELAAVAELKLNQIAMWRQERLADARFLSQARFVVRDVSRSFETPDDAAAQTAVTHWLALLKRDDRYDAVVLYDAQLQVRASLPANPGVSPESVVGLMAAATETRDVVMGDLHPGGVDGGPRLSLLVPIYADPDRRVGKPIAVILLRLNPRRHLFPLIQTWPTPSRTAETLIVRREGDQILYLNELRHRSGTALGFRLPLNSPDLPAARVLRGQTDTGEGVDYRGIKVVYVGRFIPGTSWAMVAKVDADELYAVLNRQTQVAALLGCVGVLTLLLVGNTVWTQRNARLLRRLRIQVTAMQSAANGIVITRADGTIQWVNPAFTRLTGYSAEEVLGRNPRLLRSGRQEASAYRDLWTTILSGRPWHGELVNRRKDGTLYDEEMTITPVADNSGRITHFVAIKQDVTQRKAAEQQQARMREELERMVGERTALLRETVSELEHFSYSITHDLRAPLRAMNTYAALLEEKYGSRLPEEGQGFVSRIQIAGTRLDNLIRDALNYSRTMGGQLPPATVDLGPLLRGIVDSYPNLQAPAVDVQVEFDSALVHANEAALTQCFANLLGNAAKFVAPGQKPRIRVTAESIDGAAAGARVRVTVRDNGIGIPPESQEKIFVMFQRLHSASEYPGTGIGLALVSKVVRRMGGTVGVHSVPGEGSDFWVELPAGDAPAI